METPGTLKIAEPCHENWSNMTPEAQGRFCASCQRCVFDFTNKTIADIQNTYVQQGGDICGRVKVSHLNGARPAVRGKLDLRRHGLKPLQMFALALMAAFTFIFATPVRAQQREIMGKIAYVAPSEVEGRVKWDSGEPAVGVSVQIVQNGLVVTSTVTDDKGHYLLRAHGHGERQVVVTAGHGVHSQKAVELTEDRRSRADFTLVDRVIMGGISAMPRKVEPIEPIVPKAEEQLMEPIHPVEIAPATEAESAKATEMTLDPTEALVLDGFEVKVFPNPTTDKVNMVVEKAGEHPLDLSIVDLQGKMVYSGKWVAFLDRHKTIDLSRLPAGVYLLRLQSGEQSLVRRVLKQ